MTIHSTKQKSIEMSIFKIFKLYGTTTFNDYFKNLAR